MMTTRGGLLGAREPLDRPMHASMRAFQERMTWGAGALRLYLHAVGFAWLTVPSQGSRMVGSIRGANMVIH